MPRASDHAVTHFTTGQRRAHMRANIVQCKELAIVVKDRDQLAVNFGNARFAFRNIANVTYGMEFRHSSAPDSEFALCERVQNRRGCIENSMAD